MQFAITSAFDLTGAGEMIRFPVLLTESKRLIRSNN